MAQYFDRMICLDVVTLWKVAGHDNQPNAKISATYAGWKLRQKGHPSASSIWQMQEASIINIINEMDCRNRLHVVPTPSENYLQNQKAQNAVKTAGVTILASILRAKSWKRCTICESYSLSGFCSMLCNKAPTQCRTWSEAYDLLIRPALCRTIYPTGQRGPGATGIRKCRKADVRRGTKASAKPPTQRQPSQRPWSVVCRSMEAKTQRKTGKKARLQEHSCNRHTLTLVALLPCDTPVYNPRQAYWSKGPAKAFYTS